MRTQMIASSVPPILWSAAEFARHRRVDAFSILVLAGIAFSLLALFGGGGARFLQLREDLVTGAIGLVFLVSLAIRRPLIFYLARATMLRNSADEAGAADRRIPARGLDPRHACLAAAGTLERQPVDRHATATGRRDSQRQTVRDAPLPASLKVSKDQRQATG
jgi:hypothetical protein